MEPKTDSDYDTIITSKLALATAGGSDGSGPKEHIAQFFTFAHLPPHLAAVSRPFAELAVKVLELPRNPERTVALRKLLEAKDAAVRAVVAK